MNLEDIVDRRELAAHLGCAYKNLVYNLYVLPESERYKVFSIHKKNGGKREICAPVSGIKHLQRKIADELEEVVSPKTCAYGYVKGKSIFDNAFRHRHKNLVVNIDLKDFFGSINFGRVRGVFMSPPFSCNKDVATVIAQICCFKGCLPQGAPSSPVISNIVCRRLDNQMMAFAKSNRLVYTRYADDITFSTGLTELPARLGTICDGRLVLSWELVSIIQGNGFSVNESKVRFAFRNGRQEVTGLIVNSFVNVPRKYVKRVRAMLHAWEKYGLAEAAREHYEKFNYKSKKVDKPQNAFKSELAGMISYIGFVKGKNSSVYTNLYNRIATLDEDNRLAPPEISYTPGDTVVFCEGKTDAIHLEAALRSFKSKGEFTGLDLSFYKYASEDKIGNGTLERLLNSSLIRKYGEGKEIYLFDRDSKEFNNKMCENGKDYKSYGNGIFSAILPVPAHRSFSEISIEHYYPDEDLKRKDKKGRRLFTCDEFDPATGNHKSETDLYYSGNRSKLRCSYPVILDSGVYNVSGSGAALSKNDFALNVSNRKGNFKNVTFDYFWPLFSLLEEIESLK